ncbi:hypothetical protein [Legionella bozemanae]|uniref:Dot/Icm T4SS effector n=1 Tax=Legionella bozemanae TaxID=447 RepID=A0A0W0S3L4_LEGBO|nr:hypothetical protein [Legionella bozemanae]KTC77737.1 Dot/Icm T4SS effector [Legionella bozemanae]STO33896.1 Uncharacterised protein [Legionella bozemanae]
MQSKELEDGNQTKRQIVSPSIEEIMGGDDITKHYLDEENKQYRIYRYNKEVYAVRMEEPRDFSHMWSSHKGEHISQRKTLGSGQFGTVYQKTNDKAFKEVGRGEDKPRDIKTNLAILDQKFLLKKHNIEEFFVLGLWNIKDKHVFNMPKLASAEMKRDELKPKFEEFILALKKVNELGYMHPDLANNVRHNSPQNMLVTAEGVRTIDLDSGFMPYVEWAKEPTDNPISAKFKQQALISGRDQWLYVYNYHYPTAEGRKVWRKEIEDWYEKNPGKTLSEDPDALYSFYKKGTIALPQSYVDELNLRKEEEYLKKNELNKENTKESIPEYRKGSTKDRKHDFREVSTDHTSCEVFKKEYQEIKGDSLKRAILKSLKDSVADIESPEDLQKFKSDFFNSPEMEIINTAQGKTTELLGKFGFKTDSHRAVVKIFEEAAKRFETGNQNIPK